MPYRVPLQQLSEKSRHLVRRAHSPFTSPSEAHSATFQLDHTSTRGTHKVKYQSDSDWDFHLDAGEVPTDVDLMLPHYRARHQPIDHRMSMCVAGQSESIKLRVVSSVFRCFTSSRHARFIEFKSRS